MKKSGNQLVEQFFDGVAPRRDFWIGKNRYYYREIERLARLLVPEGSRVLELGCGTGGLLAAVKPSVGVGVDVSGRMIEIARSKYPGLRFIHSAAEDLQLEEDFDYIILSDTLSSSYDVQAVLKGVRRLASPRTRILITTFNYLWQPLIWLAMKLGQRMPQPPQNWLSRADLANLCALAGLQTIVSSHLLLCPRHIPGLSGFINRFIAHLPLVNHLCLVQYRLVRKMDVIAPEAAGSRYSCSVVIPARNEKGNIENAVKRMPRLGRDTEIIFVEGNSRDGTWEEILRVARVYGGEWDIRALRQEGAGKGDAVRLGFSAARGDILMILDADLTVAPEDLSKFYEAIATGQGEFINGCRLVYPMEKQAMAFLNNLGNKFFGALFSYLLGIRLKDTLCGTKVLFRWEYDKIAAGRAFFGDFDPFGDFDLIFGAVKQGLKVIEVPIRYRSRTYGSTNINRFRDGWLLLRMSVFAARKIKFV